MQSDFEAKEIKNAKSVLDEELQSAMKIHSRQKKHEEEILEASSLWMKIKSFFRRMF